MPTVWVEAGRKIGDLSDFLARQSPAHTLESATVVPWVRVGGAVSNGCHGTGIHHVEFPELIVRMQLVQDVGGAAVLTSYERPDPMMSPQDERDRWRALLVNLGTLGVIYSVTFECVPMFNVRYRDSHDSMEQVFDTLLPSIINTQYSEIFWFPYSKKCRIKTWESTNDPLEGMPAGHWFWQWLQIRFLGPPIYHLASLFPWFTKIALWLFDLIVPEIERVVQLPEAMHYQRHFSKVVVMGYGIPIDLTAPDPYARFRQAWFAVVDRIDALENQGLYPQNLVLHTRFIGDAAGQSGKPFIAPSTGNQQTAYIEILTHRGTPGFEEYFETIEGEWLSLGGRPHWGKITFHRDEIRDAYPRPNMEAFLRVREELDPNRVFLNDYLRELLRVGS
jgi:L-gulonolactone oxidase